MDIKQCRGRYCPLKNDCARTEKLRDGIMKYEGLYADLFALEPMRYKDGKFHCEFYKGAISKYIMAEMQSELGEKFTKKG